MNLLLVKMLERSVLFWVLAVVYGVSLTMTSKL